MFFERRKIVIAPDRKKKKKKKKKKVIEPNRKKKKKKDRHCTCKFTKIGFGLALKYLSGLFFLLLPPSRHL